jgi:hypothetical protein
MASWMREPPLRAIIDDCLSPARVAKRDLLSVPAVANTYKTFYNSARTDPPAYQLYERVWLLTVLELWSRSYLDA